MGATDFSEVYNVSWWLHTSMTLAFQLISLFGFIRIELRTLTVLLYRKCSTPSKLRPQNTEGVLTGPLFHSNEYHPPLT
jgi:hypothetical protein